MSSIEYTLIRYISFLFKNKYYFISCICFCVTYRILGMKQSCKPLPPGDVWWYYTGSRKRCANGNRLLVWPNARGDFTHKTGFKVYPLSSQCNKNSDSTKRMQLPEILKNIVCKLGTELHCSAAGVNVLKARLVHDQECKCMPPAQTVNDAKGLIRGQTLCPGRCLEFISKSLVRMKPVVRTLEIPCWTGLTMPEWKTFSSKECKHLKESKTFLREKYGKKKSTIL